MSLSAEGVDYIFGRLAGVYMSAWDRLLGAIPISDAKTVWGHELDEFGRSEIAKRRILWALDNLPERPPNAVEFKRLCRQAPAPDEKLLPPPAIDEKKVAEQLLKLGEARIKAARVEVGRLDWAHRLKARDEFNPKSVTSTVRKMYRDALKEAA